MRVTAEMMVDQSVRRLSQRMASYERVQQQVATGKRFQQPSGAPADASTGLALRAALRTREQEQRSAADAESWINVADTQLRSAVERLHRLRDLAISAQDPALSPGARLGVQTEMRAIQDDLVNIANSRHSGRPLFGGFTDGAPVGGGPGAWTFSDDGGHVVRVIGPGEEIRVNVTATEAFTFTTATGDPDSAFAVIDDLVAAIDSGAPVSPLLDRVDAALDQLSAQQGRLGATGSQLETAMRRNSDNELTLRTQLSSVEDVDIAEALMELQIQQIGFEATLKAVGSALPPSLVNFL